MANTDQSTPQAEAVVVTKPVTPISIYAKYIDDNLTDSALKPQVVSFVCVLENIAKTLRPNSGPSDQVLSDAQLQFISAIQRMGSVKEDALFTHQMNLFLIFMNQERDKSMGMMRALQGISLLRGMSQDRLTAHAQMLNIGRFASNPAQRRDINKYVNLEAALQIGFSVIAKKRISQYLTT